MDYLAFLDKNDQLKLKLLASLVAAPDHRIMVKRVLNQLNTTKYKLDKIVAEIAQNLADTHVTDCQVFIDSGFVNSRGLLFPVCHRIQLFLLKKSIRFKIFQYDYFEKNRLSRKTFLAQHFISQARYYELRNEINALVADEAQLKRVAQLHVHPETVIRANLANIYYHFFSGIEEPFPEISELTSRWLTQLVMTIGLSLSPHERGKLKIYCQVQFKRIASGCALNLRQLFKLQTNDTTALLVQFFHQHVKGIVHTDAASETVCLYLFMLSQSMLSQAPITLEPQLERLLAANEHQVKAYLNDVALIDQQLLPVHQLGRIASQISALNSWLMIFDMTMISTNLKEEIAGLSTSFPGLAKLAKDIAIISIRTMRLESTTELQEKLTYNYLLQLIERFPHEAMADTIKICVDFGRNRVPVSYMHDQLRAHIRGGVIISSKLSVDADIYLSDAVISGLPGIVQVTWPNPLHAPNWNQLLTAVENVKSKKILAVENQIMM